MKFSRRTFAGVLGLAAMIRAKPAAPARDEEEPRLGAGWKPQFFKAHEAETFATVAEVIIPKTDTPGAREALVHQHVDKILLASPLDSQTKFLDGLWWLDGYALRTHEKPFRELSRDLQQSMLVALLDASDPGLRPGRDFVDLAKRLTSHVYYSTEIGNRELNKDGRVPSDYMGHCE